ncbi:MAG: sulfatase-like hydrolase/transferase [Lachnospiraceae bacterium]|nr:sulfatase-like hydrolase/transferase [Lachnospiraceae bacterium]
MSEKWPIMKEKWNALWKNFFFSCYLPSMFCYIFVELCSRKSVLELGLFFLRNPLVFFYNVFIIAATASVCLLFKRKVFVLSLVMILWTAIGITDMILLSFRTTPFTAVDLVLIKDALQIAHRYLSWVGVVLIGAGVVLAVVLCIVLFRKARKEEGSIDYVFRLPFCGLLFILCLVLTDIGMAAGLLDRNFGNLAQAFHDNGLPYCFMNSILNTGVERPEDYSAETMGDLLEEFEKEEGRELVTDFPKPTTVVSEQVTPEPVQTPTPLAEQGESVEHTTVPENTEHTTAPETVVSSDSDKEADPEEQPEVPEKEKAGEPELPNIIFLQLESFFDVKYIENFSCTSDPVPFFTYLKETYPSGFLEVPSIGAGTANTEFECITGMNLDFFGPGEYPYKTILKERTCESMAYILKEQGFSASAMHNNDGTFYDRHQVFSNLGFDRYISIEYMADASVNELNWAKDRILTEQIVKVLQSTEEKDYIYAISVQGHGAYPEEPLLDVKLLDVQMPEELAEYYYQYLYYVHQLFEMDQFIKELVLNLNAWPEDVVLVMYGDHLPGLGLSDELLENGNQFQTEYIIWSNFLLEAEDKDIQSYQLSSHIFDILGIEEGIMTQYHQFRQDEEDYQENMQLLMYDMLYGDMEVYEGENPYEPTELKMGVDEIKIREVYVKKAILTENEPLVYITGDNFTEWSTITVNGEDVETIYLNRRLLAATELPESEEGTYVITVRQQGNDGIVLSETAAMEYRMEE